MTGNKNTWRAPLAGLASLAMIATMGVAAGTANAAFKPSDSGEYTVTVEANGGTFADDFESSVEGALRDAGSTGADVVLNADKAKDATKATIKKVKGNTKFSVFATPAATKLVFAGRVNTGWFANAAAGVAPAIDLDNTKVTSDTTVYPHWAVKNTVGTDQATVEFYGSNGQLATQTFKPGDYLADWQVKKLSIFPNETDPQQLAALTTKANDKSTAIDLSTYKFQSGTTKLYAFYETGVKVEYKTTDTAQTLAKTSQYVIKGKAFDKPADPTTTNTTDNTFAGWYELAAGKTEYKTADDLADAPFNFETGTDKAIVLYAKFAPKAAVDKLVVTFKLNATKDYGTDEVVKGTTVSKPADPTDPDETGKPFLFWTTSSNPTKDSAEYIWSQSVNSALALYAVWGDATTSKVSVKFDENWDNGKITTVKANADGSVDAPADPVRDGFKFVGWYNDSGAPVDVESETFAADTTLFAKWATEATTEADKLIAFSSDIKDNGGTVISHAYANKDNFTEDSLNAYLKVYKKNADALKSGTESEKAEAVKTVKAAQAKLVAVNQAPVYRVYDVNGSRKHLYTTNAAEAAALKAAGWRDEGVAFNVASGKSRLIEDASYGFYVPVYRLYDQPAKRHLYTTDKTEYETLVASGWRDEGVAWYARTNGGEAVYRAYSPSRYEHLFTTNQTEYENATNAKGEGWYRAEGVKFNAE